MTQTAEDAARLLQVMAGHDPRDSTSMDAEVPDYLAAINEGGGRLDGLKLGIPEEFYGEGIDAEVQAAVTAAIAQFEALGASTQPVSLPHTKYSLPVYYLIATSEASSNLARFDGIRFGTLIDKGDMWDSYRATRGQGFGAEVKRRIMLGTYALSAGYYDAFYGKASQVRTLIKGDYDSAFQDVDLLVTPVAPTTAFKIGENVSDPLQMYLADVMTLSASLAGVCGISVPAGFDSAGLPIGVQLIGPAFGEAQLLRAAHAFQGATDYHTRRPDLAQTTTVGGA